MTFTQIFKTLLSRKARITYGIIGVAFCVMVVTASFSITNGLMVYASEVTKPYSVTKFLLIINKDAKALSDSSISKSLRMDEKIVAASSSQIFVLSRLSVGGNTFPVVVRGLDLKEFQMVRELKLDGKEPSPSKHEAIIGKLLAERLNILKGQEVQLLSSSNSIKVKVTGIFNSNSHYDEEILTSYEVAEILRPEMKGNVSLFEVKLKEPNKAQQFIDSIKGLGLSVMMERAVSEFIQASSMEIYNALSVTSLIMFGLASIVVFLTTLDLTKKNRWEIGMLRALGARGKEILIIIISYSLLTSLAGGLLGFFLGILLANSFSIALSIIFNLTYIHPSLNSYTTLLLLASSIISGSIGGFYPALRSSKEDIIKLLRGSPY